MANGKEFSNKIISAAHRTLPLGTKIKVTDPETGRFITVVINDRGPYVYITIKKNGKSVIILDESCNLDMSKAAPTVSRTG